MENNVQGDVKENVVLSVAGVSVSVNRAVQNVTKPNTSLGAREMQHMHEECVLHHTFASRMSRACFVNFARGKCTIFALENS
jgi:hypothetical protein